MKKVWVCFDESEMETLEVYSNKEAAIKWLQSYGEEIDFYDEDDLVNFKTDVNKMIAEAKANGLVIIEKDVQNTWGS